MVHGLIIFRISTRFPFPKKVERGSNIYSPIIQGFHVFQADWRNNEKRRDDQNPKLSLAEDGWESFLSHEGSRRQPGCKTCAYWRGLWPDPEALRRSVTTAKERVRRFQLPYRRFALWSVRARDTISRKVETLYRDCQKFATDEIEVLSSGIEFDFSGLGISDHEERPGNIPQPDATHPRI